MGVEAWCEVVENRKGGVELGGMGPGGEGDGKGLGA